STVFLVTGLVGTNACTWQDRLFCAVATSAEGSVRFAGSHWELRNDLQRAAAYRALVARLKRMEMDDKDRALARLVGCLRPYGESWDHTYSIMSWQEVHELKRTGFVDFGAHTHTHQILSRCGAEKQAE